MSEKRLINKPVITLIIFAGLFVFGFLISMGLGAVKISPFDIFDILTNQKESRLFQILWNVRLPRTIVAALVGMSLATSGAILQGVMRNNLASPNIIGVSAGGGFTALVILILFPGYYYLVPVGAFLGALSATLIIYTLSWRDGIRPSRLILSGVAIASLFGAGNNALMTFFPERVSGVISFMVGGLSGTTWKEVYMVIPYMMLGVFIVLLMPQKLNILALGDEVATGLGLEVEKTRFILIITASLLAGASVAVVGLLGFVGLIIPHMTRFIIGSDNKFLIPGCILFGGGSLMIFDTIARTAFAPAEIPVGIIMSILGAPFFLYLLRRKD